MVSERRDPDCPKYSECLSEAIYTKVPFSCKICKEKGFKSPVKKREVSMRIAPEKKSMETDLGANSIPNIISTSTYKLKEEGAVNIKKPCAQCNGELPEKRSKFCSDKCMWKWHKENKNSEGKAKRIIPKPGPKSILGLGKKVPKEREKFLSKFYPQVASPEEIMRMLEKGVVLKVIALLKKEFDV